jgi:hypothetical protein
MTSMRPRVSPSCSSVVAPGGCRRGAGGAPAAARAGGRAAPPAWVDCEQACVRSAMPLLDARGAGRAVGVVSRTRASSTTASCRDGSGRARPACRTRCWRWLSHEDQKRKPSRLAGRVVGERVRR